MVYVNRIRQEEKNYLEQNGHLLLVGTSSSHIAREFIQITIYWISDKATRSTPHNTDEFRRK